MRAEELSVPYEIDPSAVDAIDVDGDFTWEGVRKDDNTVNLAAKFEEDKKDEPKDAGKKRKKKGGELLPTATDLPEKSSGRSDENVPTTGGGSGDVKEEGKPFELKDIKLKIPKGSFVAIVGRVGSGKVSSLLFLHVFLVRSYQTS